MSKKVQALFSFCAFHFIDDGFTDSIYLLLPFMALELNLSFSQVGLLKGVYSGSMSLIQFPLSLMGERIGELTVIAVGTLGLTAGFLILSKVYTFPLMLLALIFAKGTGGGQHGLSSSLLSRIFEISGRRAAMGTYNFSGDIGKVCFPFLLALMINWWGWRQAVFNLSTIGLIAGAVLWGLARKNAPPVMLPSKERLISMKGDWGIHNAKSFFALLTIGVIDLMTRNALLTFLPFLLLRKGISETQIGFALTLLFAGGAVGKLACGLLAEWFGVIPMVVGTEILTSVGILTLTWFSPSVIWILLPVVGIVLNGTSSVLYATVAEILSPMARSRGYGLYYAITSGSGALSPLVYGLLTDAIGLSFSIVCAALMVLPALPLSKFLSRDESLSS